MLVAEMCQWANNADDTVPVEYYPIGADGQAGGLYANRINGKPGEVLLPENATIVLPVPK
jgi:hypothetical protein